jgi:hypothetical protein
VSVPTSEITAFEMIMTKLFSNRSVDEFREKLFTFIWNFNTGDNVVYNYAVLQALYSAMRDCQHADPKHYLKPLTVTLVSIAEAILVDFLDRLDQGTNHLPNNIDKGTIQAFKDEVGQSKKKVAEEIDGEEYIFLKRKMYHWGDLVKLFKKHEMFGAKSDPFYEQLDEFGKLRNRVHIENYHNNFDRKECKVFTEDRIGQLEKILETLFTKMLADYHRPWPESHARLI